MVPVGLGLSVIRQKRTLVEIDKEIAEKSVGA